MERKNRRPVLQAAPGQTVQGRSLEIRSRRLSRRPSLEGRRRRRMLNTCCFCFYTVGYTSITRRPLRRRHLLRPFSRR